MSGQIKLNLPAGGSVTVAASDSASNTTLTLPNADGSVVTTTATQTLTNKTLTNPTLTAPTVTGELDLPTWTTAGRPASPATGAIGFNTTLGVTETWSGTAWVAGGGQLLQSVKTADFNASAGNLYPVNTTSGVITATLPASPVAGQTISFVDYAGTFATNKLILNPNGNKINAASGSTFYVAGTNRLAVTFTYIDSTQGWLDTSDGAGSGIAVPTYTASLAIWGGGGAAGGAGGAAEGTITFIPYSSSGLTYAVVVGGGGNWIGPGGGRGPTVPGGGGYTGTDGFGGQGGGYSGFFVTSSTQGNAQLLAGGGGGRAWEGASGGGGGGSTGQNGGSGADSGGGGGTQTGTNGGGCGGAGALYGGNAEGGDGGGGGGGGGGYFGGNGGCGTNPGSGGGGGSGYYNPSTISSATLYGASGSTPGNSSSPLRGSYGNQYTQGVVIIYYAGAQRGTGGTVTSSGGYTYHTFTSAGTYTP